MANQTVFVVHCYVERKRDIWQAFSMEFGLAAQGESCGDAKKRLDRMIHSYLYDALVGKDKAHQEELLKRRAPLYQRLKYQIFATLAKLGAIKVNLVGMTRVFKDRVPLGPITADC